VTTPLAALQETLAAEHAAVYVYGVLGGRLSTSAFPVESARIRAAYDAHRSRRDLVRALVSDRDAEPVASAAAYAVPLGDGSVGAFLRAALDVEEGCAEVYSQLGAATSDQVRRLGITALTETGLRILDLGGGPTPYPGAPDLL
jgi:hypothetical protein